MEIKSKIKQIEDIKLKDVKDMWDLIELLKEHKKLWNEDSQYHRCRTATD